MTAPLSKTSPSVLMSIKLPADLKAEFIKAVECEKVPGMSTTFVIRSLMVDYIKRSGKSSSERSEVSE